MIIKVAEAMALKRAFAISGLVTQEEMGSEISIENVPHQTAQAAQTAQTQSRAEIDERKIQLTQLFNRYMAVCDGQKNHAINAMKKVTGKESSADFTQDDIKALFDDVIRREDEKTNAEIGFTDVEFSQPDETENKQTTDE